MEVSVGLGIAQLSQENRLRSSKEDRGPRSLRELDDGNRNLRILILENGLNGHLWALKPYSRAHAE